MSGHPRHVYVHVPFCARRCSYCDFAIAVRRSVPVGDYLSALRRELSLRASGPRPWRAATMYLGGGTPSLLGGDGVAGLLEALGERCTPEPGAEVTLEANPEDVTLQAARRWRASGINRLSLGAQSFDDRVLRWMRRTHGSEQIERAVGAARDAGIENLSLDLIFALPLALGRDWARDLALALALAPEHLSVYGLTVERATPLARWQERGLVHEAPEETYEAEFIAAHDALTAAGYEHYEVSNYARPGRRSRHNSAYWERSPYLGLGPSAHSFDGARRWWNVPPYAEWVRLLSAGQDPAAGSELLTDEEREEERIYLALRTAKGLPLDGLDRSLLACVSPWEGAGWATLADERVRLTPAGWLRLDSLAAGLTVVPSRY
jgi:oxygen-independent coproporphyrinogen-3 oxidase